MSHNRKAGRPRGSKACPVDVVIVQPASTCRRCGSARRVPYWNPRTHEANGTKTTWRRTRCLDCHQVRDDKTIEKIRPDELNTPPPPRQPLPPPANPADCNLLLQGNADPAAE